MQSHACPCSKPLNGLQSGHAALLGALRREAAAASCGRRAAAEAERLRELLRQREMDMQRSKMIIRLKEQKVARLQASFWPTLSFNIT